MKKNQKKRLRRDLLLVLIVLLLGFLGAREVYQRLYGHRTLVLTDTVRYEKRVDFTGAVLYDQVVVESEDAQIDPAYDGKRAGAHAEIGRMAEITKKDTGDRKEPDELIDAIKTRRFDAITSLVSLLPEETEITEDLPEEEPEESEDDIPPPTQYVPSTPYRITDGTIVLGEAAYVSAKPDGFESLLPFDGMEQMRGSDITALQDYPPAAKEKAGFTLINDHRYGIALLTEQRLEPAGQYELQIGDAVLQGNSRKNHGSGEGSLILLDMDEGFLGIYPQRFIRGSIIVRAYEALKIPVGAFTEVEGEVGVFLKNDDAIVEFVPTPEKEEEDGFVYLPVDGSSLHVYDEIYLHPSGLKEGDFIE